MPRAVQHLLRDAYLLQVLLPRIGVVSVHYHPGILQPRLGIEVVEQLQVLVMIVGMRIAARIHIAAQNRMGQRVALALHLPVAVDEGMRGLRRLQRVHHHREIAARGVLHAHGDVDAARGQPVLLVLDRTRPHGHVGEQVGEILVVLRVEHLVGAGESGLVESPDVQFPDGDEALEHVGRGARVRLVEHALVAGARGAGLVGVDAGHDDYLVGHLLLHPAQARDVVDHGVLPVG